MQCTETKEEKIKKWRYILAMNVIILIGNIISMFWYAYRQDTWIFICAASCAVGTWGVNLCLDNLDRVREGKQ